MLPRDTNAHGTIFGGVILSYIDMAGGIECRRQSPKKFVTKAICFSVNGRTSLR